MNNRLARDPVTERTICTFKFGPKFHCFSSASYSQPTTTTITSHYLCHYFTFRSPWEMLQFVSLRPSIEDRSLTGFDSPSFSPITGTKAHTGKTLQTLSLNSSFAQPPTIPPYLARPISAAAFDFIRSSQTRYLTRARSIACISFR